MKRTTTHVKKSTKPARQPTFKTPAQELKEFKDTVLALNHGGVLWSILTRAEDKGAILEEFAAMLASPAPAIFQRLFPNAPIDKDCLPIVRDATLPAGIRELESELGKLWPEYERLLGRNPAERRAYQERYKRFLNQNPLPVQDRMLRQERGRPRDRIARDELIVSLCQQAPQTDQQIAHTLAHKYGITMSRQAVRQARERDQERRRLQTPKPNSL